MIVFINFHELLAYSVIFRIEKKEHNFRMFIITYFVNVHKLYMILTA
jgi:hypothetical protein